MGREGHQTIPDGAVRNFYGKSSSRFSTFPFFSFCFFKAKDPQIGRRPLPGHALRALLPPFGSFALKKQNEKKGKVEKR